METITVAQLEALVANEEWLRRERFEVMTDGPGAQESVDGNSDPHLFGWAVGPRAQKSADGYSDPHLFGWAEKTSLCDASRIVITYSEWFDYDGREPGALLKRGTSRVNPKVIWRVSGAAVVDDNGRKLNPWEVSRYLTPAFSELDYSKQGIKSGYTRQPGDQPLSIQLQDNGREWRFNGQMIARVSNGRSTFSLYRVDGGRYVCQRSEESGWLRRTPHVRGDMYDTVAEVKAFFGTGRLAKKLYAESGLDGGPAPEPPSLS